MTLSQSVLRDRSHRVSSTDEGTVLAFCRGEVQQPLNPSVLGIEQWQKKKGEDVENKSVPLFSTGEKTLFLKAFESKGSAVSYILSVENDNHEVFLLIYLEDVGEGKVTYSQEEPYWHQVTLQSGNRRLFFKLSKTPQAEKFNAKLSNVLEHLRRASQESQIEPEFCPSGTYAELEDDTFLPSPNKTSSPPHPRDLPDPYIHRTLPPVPQKLPVQLRRPQEPPPLPPSSSSKGRYSDSTLYKIQEGTVTRDITERPRPTTLPAVPPVGSMLSEMASGGQGVAGSMPTSHATSPSKDSVLSRLDLLTAAVKMGDVANAQSLVAELAHERRPLVISLDQSALEAEEQEFNLKVIIEDRDAAGVVRNLKVKPSYSIKFLKQMVELQLGFPQAVQQWIVGMRLAKDAETLTQLRVRGEGSTVYLYLVTARSVNLTQEAYNRQSSYGTLPPGACGDYMSMQAMANVVHGNAATPVRQQSSQSNNGPSLNPNPSPQSQRPTFPHTQLSNAAQGGDMQTPLLVEGVQQAGGGAGAGGGGGGRPRNEGAPIHGGRPIQQDEEPKIGWTCPQCTLINSPMRPGCEVCSAERPANYQVPANYVMTPEERQFMQLMQQQEEFARRAEGAGPVGGRQGAQQGGGGNNLSEEQLDLVLRFNDTLQDQMRTRGSSEEDQVQVQDNPLVFGQNQRQLNERAPNPQQGLGVPQWPHDSAALGQEVLGSNPRLQPVETEDPTSLTLLDQIPQTATVVDDLSSQYLDLDDSLTVPDCTARLSYGYTGS